MIEATRGDGAHSHREWENRESERWREREKENPVECKLVNIESDDVFMMNK